MIDIVLCASGADEVRLVHDLSTEHRQECRVVRRCADLAETLGAAAAGVGDAVVIDLATRGLDRDVIAQMLQGTSAVVGLSPTDPDPGATALGLRVVVPSSVDGGALLAAVREALEDPTEVQAAATVDTVPAPLGRVIAVWGPTGSPGRTTVATNLAREAALAGVDTLLVDADTYGPAVTQLLGVVDEAPGLVAASRAQARDTLDDETLASLTTVVAPGLRVLSGIGAANRWAELRAESLPGLWDRLSAHAELVIIDAGFCLEEDEELSYDTLAPRRNAATATAVTRADRVLAVVGADPVHVTRLLRERERLTELGADRLDVVITRADDADRAAQIAALVQDRISIESITALPLDAAACSRALWEGGALADIAPRSALRRAIADLVVALGLAAASPAGSPRPRGSARPSMLGGLRRRGRARSRSSEKTPTSS